MVYGVLALTLAGMQLRLQQSAIEQTVLYMSKQQTLEFADLLEQDMKSIGAGIDGTMIESITTDDATNLTTAFSFNTTDDVGDEVAVSYAVQASDIIEVDGVPVQRYQMKRYENGVLAGGGPATIRAFRIELLNDAGTATVAASARLVRVSFVNAYPFASGDAGSLRQTYWGTTVRPINMQS